MSIVAAFTGTYCREDPAIREIIGRTGFRYLTDGDIISKASCVSGLSEDKLGKAFHAKASVFNQFTHEKELSVAYIKLALAKELSEDRTLINGFTSLLIPSSVTDVLRICLIADTRSRVSAADESGVSAGDALRVLYKDHADRAAWVKNVAEKDDPWDPSLYDIVLPTDKMSSKEIGRVVAEALEKNIFARSSAVKKAIQDFVLASRIEAALIKEGHYYVTAEADSGTVTLTTNKNVLLLKHLEHRLMDTAVGISGVANVKTKVGKDFHKTDIIYQFDPERPVRQLAVNDDRQFVHMLSERLCTG